MYNEPHLRVVPTAVWRVLTSAVFHMGILHVAFNMMAFVPIGQSLERLLGTVQVRGSPGGAATATHPTISSQRCLAPGGVRS